FVWEAHMGGPLLLIAGGSGVVPLMAMIRHRAALKSVIPTRLLYSSRSYDEVIYRDELGSLLDGGTQLQVWYTLARTQPRGWIGYRRRIDADLLREVAWPPDEHPLVFICRRIPFFECVAANPVALGSRPDRT